MILARHAEAMFWSGRHLERTEHATRVLDIAGMTSMHHRPERTGDEWMRVLRLLGLAGAFEERGSPLSEAEVVRFAFADTSHAGSVISTAQQLRENIRAVRDRVPVQIVAGKKDKSLHAILGVDHMLTILAILVVVAVALLVASRN